MTNKPITHDVREACQKAWDALSETQRSFYPNRTAFDVAFGMGALWQGLVFRSELAERVGAE